MMCVAIASLNLMSDSVHAQTLPDVQGLIDDDPAIRQQTLDDLLKVGPEARAMLQEASRSDSAALRRAANSALEQLPRDLETDAPEIRKLLKRYGPTRPENRREIIGRILAIDPQQSRPALWRLLATEPDGEAMWYLAGELLNEISRDDANRWSTWEPQNVSPPQAFVIGWALRYQDRAKSIAFLQHSLNASAVTSQDAMQHRLTVLKILYELYLRQRNHDDALTALRRIRQMVPLMKQFDPTRGDANSAAADVVVHQAKFGASPDWLVDVLIAMSQEDTSDGPRAAPATVALLERMGYPAPGRIYWNVMRQTPQTNRRWRASQVLSELNREAEVARLLQDDPNGHLQLYVALAWYRHHRHSSGPAQALESSQQLVRLIRDDIAFSSAVSPLELPRMVTGKSWKQSLVANQVDLYRQAGDLQSARAVIDQLRDNQGTLLSLLDEGDASDLLPALRELGQNEEAEAVFRRFFDSLSRRINSEPDSATLFNQAAWLCASAAMELPKAESWARRAVEIEPYEAAYHDTLALILFEQGKLDEAIAMQRRAAELEPTHRELVERLRRFEAAKK
jgi:tetratricopeptide (TPR) repeat protein